MRHLLCLPLALWLLLAAQTSHAHALDPGYLDLRQLATNTWQVLWRKPDVNGQPMDIDAVLPSQCSEPRGPEPRSDGSAWIATWVVDCTGGLASQIITIEGLERQRNDVLLRVQPLSSSPATFRFTPDAPSLTIPERPTTWSVLGSYFQLGFEHILEGWDHLLFVFALFVLVRDPWRLVGAVTAFTVAHSITLALATLGVLHVPGPPVEAVIALSIVFLALEILNHKDGTLRLSEKYPWIVCFCFGLLHGLGFAGALAEIGVPSDDLFAALLAFNLGVEAGQLLFIGALSAVILAWRFVLPTVSKAIAPAVIPVTGYAIGCVSMYWLVERVSGF
ncbi:HupE/UreJ family protein [Ruegeria sp. R14_0]|uniref:HupE/UreJ family protein n=1 Tax=Ruegeria sp. R14_0 TaxID=2821100 RepID=UPI001ADC5AA6|nr:HupE/UreJ family protein [Ruegeria sp. R14_0]MBO9446306.1 HupE/UreJ family protein [Ruegeria sp. R14_0]